MGKIVEQEESKTKTQDEESEREEDEEDQILLLIRKKGGEYFLCGNVTQAGYDTTKHPIRIIWELFSHQSILSKNKDFKELLRN